MQRDVSTNIHLPEDVWKAIKIKAAQEGKSMKQLILEGIQKVLGGKKNQPADRDRPSLKNLFLEFAGKVEADVTDGSTEHDRYIYDEK